MMTSALRAAAIKMEEIICNNINLFAKENSPGKKTSWGKAVRLGKVRGDKRIITLEPMNGFQRFKKGNCSEFDGPSIQSTAKAPK